jgi:hypothetical protein
MVKIHTFGTTERFFVDGVLNLSKDENRRPLERYLYNNREAEFNKYRKPDHHVDSIKSASYNVSKNGNGYTRLELASGRYILSFRDNPEPFEAGEIIVWRSQQLPFADIEERIK